MWVLLDIVGSEYGWDSVNSMGLDEALFLIPKIKARKLEKYKMDLLIIHTGKPEQTIKELDRINVDFEDRSEKLDISGFERFKNALSKSRAIVIK